MIFCPKHCLVFFLPKRHLFLFMFSRFSFNLALFTTWFYVFTKKCLFFVITSLLLLYIFGYFFRFRKFKLYCVICLRVREDAYVNNNRYYCNSRVCMKYFVFNKFAVEFRYLVSIINKSWRLQTKLFLSNNIY